MRRGERDRFVDAVRVGSIVVVVLGHWLMAAVVRRDGELRAANALAAMPWLQPLTWVLQVVPLFFVAAGFASARALSRPGRRSARFLMQRVARVVPTPAVMAVVAGLALLMSAAAGAPPSTVRDVGAVVAQPLWFLAVYVFVALAAPLQLRVHRRLPGLLLVVLPVATLALDYVRLARGQTQLATLNYLWVFAFAQEVGFWYADGRPGRWAPVRWLTVAAGAAAALLALTRLGPYPVSMIGLPGQVSNMAPPTICITVLTVGQVSLLMALRPTLLRLLRRPRVWRLVSTGNGLALSLFTWHLVALVLAYGASIWVGAGTPAPGSGSWWALKPVIVVGAAALLWGLLAVSLPLERRLAGAALRSTSTARAVAATLLAAASFAAVAAWGLSSPFAVSDSAFLGVHGVPAVAVGCAVVAWLLVVAPWTWRADPVASVAVVPSGTMAAVPGARQYLTLRRLGHALSGWRGGVALVGCVLGAVALAFIPSDQGDHRLARQMQERSEAVVVDDVEVYVARHWGGKGGPSWEVDDVRVRLPGRDAPVLLEGVVGNDVTAEWSSLADPTEGWQPPTRATSYDQEPLRVRVLRLDGREHVMAQEDVDYWGVGNHDVRTDLVLGVGGLSAAITWAVGCVAVDAYVRRRWQRTRPTGPRRDGEGRHR